jgi:hypothetical protein
VVCELDPADLQDRLASQEIAVRGAQADVQGTRLAREVAVMELNDYKQGVFVKDLAASESEIKMAEANLARAEDVVEWTRRMFDKGYVSLAQKVSEELTLKQAVFAVELAQSKR